MPRGLSKPLLALLCCLPLAWSCSEQPSAPIRVTILRDGVPDDGALNVGGRAAGVPAVQDIACALQAGDGVKSSDCQFTLHSGQSTWGPYITLPRGLYRVVYRFNVTPDCAGGHMRFDVRSKFSGSEAIARSEETIDRAREVSVDFMTASNGGDVPQLEFRTFADSEHPVCVVLADAKLLAE